MRKPWPADKHPEHPSTLRIRDVHPGVRYVTFAVHCGIIQSGEFLSQPFVAPQLWGRNYVDRIVARAREAGAVRLVDLAQMGIIPQRHLGRYVWVPCCYTVPANRSRSLPAPNHEPHSIERVLELMETRDSYSFEDGAGQRHEIS